MNIEKLLKKFFKHSCFVSNVEFSLQDTKLHQLGVIEYTVLIEKKPFFFYYEKKRKIFFWPKNGLFGHKINEDILQYVHKKSFWYQVSEKSNVVPAYSYWFLNLLNQKETFQHLKDKIYFFESYFYQELNKRGFVFFSFDYKLTSDRISREKAILIFSDVNENYVKIFIEFPSILNFGLTTNVACLNNNKTKYDIDVMSDIDAFFQQDQKQIPMLECSVNQINEKLSRISSDVIEPIDRVSAIEICMVKLQKNYQKIQEQLDLIKQITEEIKERSSCEEAVCRQNLDYAVQIVNSQKQIIEDDKDWLLGKVANLFPVL